VYAARAHAPALALGREAARRRVRCFVECSTGMVYKPGRSTARDERARLEPWSRLAEWKLRAERDLAEVPGLNLLVLRMANVYGPYMARFLGTALALARVYQSERTEMKFLWDRDLKTHTVHVEDAARAVFEAAMWYIGRGERGDAAPVFNIVDSGDCCEFLSWWRGARLTGV
jgi:nucleoside-diphosphate-sugar epimerase